MTNDKQIDLISADGTGFQYYLHTAQKHNMTRSSRSSAAFAGMSLRCSLRCIAASSTLLSLVSHHA